MYENTTKVGMVRATEPAYGGDPACDDRWERGPADLVLEDLASARDAVGAGRVLARFAVVRFWVLRAEAAEPALLDHARESAHAYLGPVEAGWSEGAALRRLAERPEPLAMALRSAGDAARAAERERQLAGACALRLAAYRVARLRLDHALAAVMAWEIAGFLRRCGARAAAERWMARGARAEAAAVLMAPPSLS